MNTIKFLAAACLMVTPLTSFAQKGVDDGSKYGHGEDSVTCIMNLVQYGDQVKLKNFKEALEPWKVVFNECPLAKGTTLYTDGVKIMKGMIKQDPSAQETYYDFLLKIYDQRIKYFGTNKKYPATYLKGAKAFDMVTYKGKDAAVRAEAEKLFEECFKGNISTIQPAFVQSYMEQKCTDYSNNLNSAEDVVNAYVLCSDLISKLEVAATDKNAEAIATTKDNVEQFFAHSGAADCATLSRIFGPQLDSHKEDGAWLKRINKLLGNGDCTDNDLFYATSEALHKISPEASSARGLAKMYLKQQDVTHALAYYDEAVKLETDDKLKAKYYYEMALVNFSDNNLSAAKSCCVNASQLRSDWGAPYLLLGRVYATGARNVGEKDYEKKAGFWAACDKFSKAKAVDSSEDIQKEANDLIRQYSQYFPSKEDLFFEGVKDGSPYHVGGFINENTTVRSKK